MSFIIHSPRRVITRFLITNYPIKQKIRIDLMKRDYRSRGVGTDPSVNIIHVAILKLIGGIDILSGLYSHTVVAILKINEIATNENWNELYILCTNDCLNISNIKIFFLKSINSSIFQRLSKTVYKTSFYPFQNISSDMKFMILL